MQRKRRCTIFFFLCYNMKSIIIMRTSKHSENSSAFLLREKNCKNRFPYEKPNLRRPEFTSHASARFVVAIFARLITQIGKESAASHMCRRRDTKKRRVRFERKKKRKIKQRVSHARERATARQRVG